MKRLVIACMIACFFMAGAASAAEVFVDFEYTELSPGDSIEGQGTVNQYLAIEADAGDAILIKENEAPQIFGAPNGAGSIANNGLEGVYGFGNEEQMNSVGDQVYTFTFFDEDGAATEVSTFSMKMYDYGDYNPKRATTHLVQVTAYDVDGVVVDIDELRFSSTSATNPRDSDFGDLYLTGDAIDATLGQPGNYSFKVASGDGTGIARVVFEALAENGIDPKIGFDEISFCPVTKAPLYAGQTIPVGEVVVLQDCADGKLYVTYNIHAPWKMTESHLSVELDHEEIPQKNGNPIPGKFEFSEYHDYVDTYTYVVDIDSCGDFAIAAHAVVEKVICEAPYCADYYVEYDQGLLANGNPVSGARSIPEQALYFEDTKNENNFFSLGFGGWMILAFDCPIVNGDGNDIQVIEDTWGSYPLESANVSVSNNLLDWTLLGEATNTNFEGIHTISEFELGELKSAKFVKVEDTTPIEGFGITSTADGYDLNAVCALNDCIQDETAWAGEFEFVGKNWAKYFTIVSC